ncbi:MAG: phage virion morphogenesis protein [Parvibaculaceae bacterium]|nr:phage virion morphogenesis protein [Parvibaculaceae bacterium]
MSGASIVIDIDDAEISAAIQRVIDAGLDPQPLWDDIGASMVVSTQQRFLAEKDPQYRFWKRHAPSTKRRRGPFATILRLANILFRSITHNVLGAGGVEWGTNVRYGAVHQLGHTFQRMTSRRIVTYAKNRRDTWRFAKKSSRAKSRQDRLVQVPAHSITIPARPYLGINADDRALVASKVEAYLARAAEGSK